MRLFALLFTAMLATASAAAAGAQASPPADTTSSAEPASQKESQLNLPVSLDRIREGQADALVTLRGLNQLAPDQAAHFTVEIEERLKIEELLATLDFRSGPVPAGGIYAYEQQRRLFPSVDNPLVQPWAAFDTSQMLTLTIENIIRKLPRRPAPERRDECGPRAERLRARRSGAGARRVLHRATQARGRHSGVPDDARDPLIPGDCACIPR